MTVKSRRANNLRTWGKDLSRKFRRICSVCPRPSTHETDDGVLFCDEHYWQWEGNQRDDEHYWQWEGNQRDKEFDESQCWACNCGNYIEDGCHCPKCGAEPPWGCPCSACQDGDDEEDGVDELAGLYADDLELDEWDDL